ncbi:TetR/AcrR family transcriptional regulator [Kitasatospora sp. NPDC006697]|uniref:TetR/AcrR family transcriptional regulator n=1 Tax=Kitasatospora sp. NPDC006697 TaxID=3364020 RepID=UPI003699DC8F
MPEPAALPALPGALRTPQQARSREKVARILAATARLLEELPPDELGTKLIAAEAGVSIGVLYRFFPDKQAIIVALAADWLEQFVSIAEQAVADPLPADPAELTGRLLDAHAGFRREQPGFQRLWYGSMPWAALREEDERNDRELAELIRGALVRGYGYPDTPEFGRRTHLAVKAAGQLLNLAFEQDPQGDPGILAELRLMLERWVLGRSVTQG